MKKTLLFVTALCFVFSTMSEIRITPSGSIRMSVNDSLFLEHDSMQFVISRKDRDIQMQSVNSESRFLIEQDGDVRMITESRLNPRNGALVPQYFVKGDASFSIENSEKSALNLLSMYGNRYPALGIVSYNNNYFISGIYATNNGNNLWQMTPTYFVQSNGTIYSANSQLTLSDESHKESVTVLTGALDKLSDVTPVSYVLNLGGNGSSNVESVATTTTATTSDFVESADNDVITDIEEIDPVVQAAIEAERVRPKYGFVAQDIAEIFPNVVYTLPTGEKAIAYQEIIPILVSAIQEQQGQIDSLVSEVESLRQTPVIPRQQAPATLEEAIAKGDAVLCQNIPNPFDQATTITYRLPERVATAMLLVCDMTGKLLQSYPLTLLAGDGSITLQAGSYAPGMYLYTLMIDGVSIDTKQMIIYK